jgi:hypothetical protein
MRPKSTARARPKQLESKNYDYPFQKDVKTKRLRSTDRYGQEEVKNFEDNKVHNMNESLNNSNLNDVSNVFEHHASSLREFTFESRNNKNNKYLIGKVMAEFHRSCEDEISCNEGDEVIVLSRQDEYFLIKNVDNKVGLVPECIIQFDDI